MENEELSLARELIRDSKAQTKRLFIIIYVLIGIIALFVGGLVYVVTNYDFSYEDTITDMSTTEGDNNYIGNDGDING